MISRLFTPISVVSHQDTHLFISRILNHPCLLPEKEMPGDFGSVFVSCEETFIKYGNGNRS